MAESLPRNQSYNYLIRVEGGWVQPIYEQAAADEKRPVTERAGAVQAMATRGEEGALGFLEGLLWRTKDETLIRAIIAAIKRLGDEEARAILESYATGGAPTPEIAEYAMRVATAPKPRATPLDGTGEGGEGGPSIQARPISPEELPGIRPR